MIEYNSITEPLPSGASLPDHPHDTTTKRVISYGYVYDVADGTQLLAGLHRNEVATLMSGQHILDHAYRYAILDRKIYHTRDQVIIEVQCVEDGELQSTGPTPVSSPEGDTQQEA